MRERPLSPHLSIVRFRYTLTSSISNRITGVMLSGALFVFVAWLVAAASDAALYDRLTGLLSSVFAKGVLAVWLIAFVYHALAGIRHLVWDTGYGLEREQSRLSAWMLGLATAVVSAALIFALFSAGADA